eukprot:COSAG01_NODE_3846_length_5644_cov_48.943192_5_plen_292_part_00
MRLVMVLSLSAMMVTAVLPAADGRDDKEACADLAARLGGCDRSVAVLCPAHCSSSSSRRHGTTAAASAPSSASSSASSPAARPTLAQLPLLFMDPGDIRDTWGHQQLVATPVVDVTAAVCNNASRSNPCSLDHPGLAYPLQGGVMAPNPLRPSAGYEIFFESRETAEGLDARASSLLREDPKVEPKSVYFMTTPDFHSFTAPIRVAALNNFSNPTNKSVGCIPKSMTRSDDGLKYVIMTICNDAGLRPMVASSPLGVLSFSAQRLTPSFWDHDDNNLGYSNGQFVDLQIMF